MYSECWLICQNSLSKGWWINEAGGLTGYTLLIVDYINTGKIVEDKKVWRIKWWWIKDNSLYVLRVM